MTLKELFDQRYLQTDTGQTFVRKFPNFYEAFKDIQIAQWDKSLEELFDKNPEIIDALDFLRMLKANGLISQEEFEKTTQELFKTHNYSSKVLGVAYIEDKTVAFRNAIPSIDVLLHEAGHVYFQKNDLLWSATYAGGEYLMWLILDNHIDGNEYTIRNYMNFLELIYENPTEANALLNDFARSFSQKYGLNAPNALSLMLFTGTLPNKIFDLNNPPDEMDREDMFSFMANMLEGVKFKDPHWTIIAENFFKLLKEV